MTVSTWQSRNRILHNNNAKPGIVSGFFLYLCGTMKRIIKSTILSALFLLASITAAAQKHTISGYITDSASSEPLIGVAVIDGLTGSGTVSSNSGYYSITLPDGERTLSIEYLGYENISIQVNLVGNQVLDIKLKEVGTMLSGAVVTSSRSEAGVLGTQMSAIEVPVSQIKAIPAIGGEVDVIKALQLLPGVQSGSEGTAGIYVRGGGADENLLLMDGVPLYNVNHLFGFFSVFNADAVKNVTLYKGSFPARFGGHLSSVIDVRMKDGNDSEYHGSVSVGLISSKINVEGPIVKGKTTFNFSARRTYLDLLAQPVLAYANKKENEGNSDGDKTRYGGGYDFYDLNAKITHRFNNNDRLSLSVYNGDDNAHIRMEDSYTYPYWEYNNETGESYESPTIKRYSKETMKFGWKWGNLVTALKWSHEISPQIYMIAGASYTQYRNKLAVGMLEYDSNLENGKEFNIYKMTADLTYNSLINDISFTDDFEWRPSAEHDIKYGASYTYHNFKPGIISAGTNETDQADPENNETFNYTIGDESLYSHEAALYFEDNWSVTQWLKANIGLRGSLYSVSGQTYFSGEPRISARALISPDLSIKASYSEMSQYIHLLCNSNLSLPSDLWVPVTKNIKPMRSRQTAIGAFYDKGMFEFSAEAYYKGMDNVLEYKDGASYMSTGTGWEEKVCMGRGWSYGLELLAQKKTGKLTGWVGYTLAKSMRKFDRPGNVINDGNPFPAKYDRRHDLSATMTYTFSPKFDLSATFVFASGNCGSLGYENFESAQVYGSGPDALLIPEYRRADYIPNRNNYRMPAYNRMDVGMNFNKQKKRGVRTWNISVYNVYNRQNPYLIFVDDTGEYNESTGMWESRTVLKQISFFPIIPSISYTFKF